MIHTFTILWEILNAINKTLSGQIADVGSVIGAWRELAAAIDFASQAAGGFQSSGGPTGGGGGGGGGGGAGPPSAGAAVEPPDIETIGEKWFRLGKELAGDRHEVHGDARAHPAHRAWCLPLLPFQAGRDRRRCWVYLA